MASRGLQGSFNLLIGDYLRVTADRPAVSGRGEDEGFARIERIEHLAEDLTREILTRESVDFGPVSVVWCHGVPGPLVLRGGDVHVLDHANPDRVRHDEAHPWWPPSRQVLLRRAPWPQATSLTSGAVNPSRGSGKSPGRTLTGRAVHRTGRPGSPSPPRLCSWGIFCGSITIAGRNATRTSTTAVSCAQRR